MQQGAFIISIKQPHASYNSNPKNINATLFESSSLYLAMCSYRNQLIQFLVRISFVSICLLGTKSIDVKDMNLTNQEVVLGDLDEYKAFEMYKCLTRLFSKEFIFHVGDELKDFNDSLSYLLHTNLIRVQSTLKSSQLNGERKFEIVKFNMRIFFFFARSFLYIIQNYVEIYRTLVESNPLRLTFNDEKTFTKSIQTTLFDKMLKSLSTNNKKTCVELYDFESLSLNLISNSILCLKQFDILIKFDKSSYELDTYKLKRLNQSLIFLIRTNRHKLHLLSKILRSFEVENNLDSKFYGDKDKFDFDYFNYGVEGENEFYELTDRHFECFSPSNIAQKMSKL